MELSDLIVGITRNLALTALVVLAYASVARFFQRGIRKGMAIGALLGVVGVFSMNDPIHFAPGVFYDGRAALLALSSPFGGISGAVVSAIVLASYRWWLGGTGTFAGVSGIFISAALGVLFNMIPLRRLRAGFIRSVLTGLVVSLANVTIVVLPADVRAVIMGLPLITVVFGNVVSVVILFYLLSRKRSRLHQHWLLERDANTDALTLLQNRRSFDVTAAKATINYAEHGQSSSLILIDIDHFKAINDKWGHQTGDDILATVATLIRKSVRHSDVVARYGGEEIAILLPETNMRQAEVLAESIRKRIFEQIFTHDAEIFGVSISAGVANFSKRMSKIENVVKAADEALYRAKNAGRNRIEIAPTIN